MSINPFAILYRSMLWVLKSTKLTGTESREAEAKLVLQYADVLLALPSYCKHSLTRVGSKDN